MQTRRAATVTRAKTDQSAGAFVRRVLDRLQDDQNLIYLAARLQSYSEITEARLEGLRGALAKNDAASIESFAHALSDSTAKMGAIKMMKLCIGLQMLGRRGLVKKAEELFQELEKEYAGFKENLISSVG